MYVPSTTTSRSATAPPSAPAHWPTPACLRACVTAVVADAAAGRQRIIFGGTILHCRVRSGSRIGPACRPDHMDLSDCISTSGMRGPRDRPPSAVLRHGQGPAARHGPLALAIHCPCPRHLTAASTLPSGPLVAGAVSDHICAPISSSVRGDLWIALEGMQSTGGPVCAGIAGFCRGYTCVSHAHCACPIRPREPGVRSRR